jgi:hypothetical protein
MLEHLSFDPNKALVQFVSFWYCSWQRNISRDQAGQYIVLYVLKSLDLRMEKLKCDTVEKVFWPCLDRVVFVLSLDFLRNQCKFCV